MLLVVIEVPVPRSNTSMTIKPSHHSNTDADFTFSWNRTDSLLLGILAVAALLTRFWRLGYPNEPVFDEIQFVGQALAYLRGEQFLDVHPGFPKLLIAAAIKLMGEHSWVWRSPSAVLGSALVLVTFLLGREMFRSRLAATLSATFVLCDGMFLIHSRLGMLEIFHITFTATSYLLLFQLLRTRDPALARRKILYLGLVSGMALASKLMIPAIGLLLVLGFLIYAMVAQNVSDRGLRNRRIVGTLVLLLSVSSIVYLVTFLPNYWLGWWGGAWSLVHYYHEVIWQLGEMSLASNPFVSPWWSWPLMLRAPLYWQSTVDGGQIATIWEGGNPVLWWASLGALMITIVREVERPTLARSFMLIGYVGYMLALALSKHPFFLYIYLAPLYLQYLMLGVVLADLWSESARRWEQIILVLSLAPACWLGLGANLGTLSLSVIVAMYIVMSWRFKLGGKFVCLTMLAAALAAFVYFLPFWLGLPLEPAGYSARVWLTGSGVAKWM
jgi:dolichyl-phosphate-mannose-protein mannosyltransferase